MQRHSALRGLIKMAWRHTRRLHGPGTLIGLLLCAVTVVGCMKFQSTTATESTAPDCREAYALLERQHRLLQKRCTRQEAQLKEAEIELNRAQLLLLEEQASGALTRKRFKAQGKMLDEAVQEVVRAKAKLRTIESRAEAASTMAEAEIAIRATQKSLAAGSGNHRENLKRAQDFLKMSTREFKNQNYAGALYLAGQARSHINAIQINRAQGATAAVQPGETAFSQPLPLKVVKRCNFRRTPDLKGSVIAVLEAGTMIVGFAHKDNWIRIQTENGHSGWVYQTLVGVR
jgi:hypothetical protein